MQIIPQPQEQKVQIEVNSFELANLNSFVDASIFGVLKPNSDKAKLAPNTPDSLRNSLRLTVTKMPPPKRFLFYYIFFGIYRIKFFRIFSSNPT